MENKYHQGKIYRIVSNVSTKQYIGSTTQPLSYRWSGHKADYNRTDTPHRCKSFDMFETDGIENCRIVLLENYPCESREELNKRERYWIETEDCINKNRPCITPEEAKEKIKELWVNNRDRYYETRKQYYEDNRNKILEHHKKYYEEHKEQAREYLEKNRETIRSRRNEKITCECGATYARRFQSKHITTSKHTTFLQKECHLDE